MNNRRRSNSRNGPRGRRICGSRCLGRRHRSSRTKRQTWCRGRRGGRRRTRCRSRRGSRGI